MPFNPNPTPTVGEDYVYSGRTFRFNGRTWAVIASPASGGGGPSTLAWSEVTDKPSAFPPSAHAHAIADVTGLETALGEKESTITKSTGYAKWNGSAWVFVNETYLTSYTETDPTVPAHVKGIVGTDISNWNAAFGWGNHASAGYLTSAAIGSSVQAYSANLTSWASLATSAKQDAITISETAPVAPTLNQLWFDIS